MTQLHTYHDVYGAVQKIVARQASIEDFFTPVEILGEQRKVLDVRVLEGKTEHSIRDLTKDGLDKLAATAPEGKPLVHIIYDLGRV